MQEELLEPLDAYKHRFKQEFSDKAQAYFDDLTKRSKVNVEENRATVKAYKAEMQAVEQIDKKLHKTQGWKGFLVFLTVVNILAGIVGIFLAPDPERTTIGVGLLFGFFFAVVWILIVFLKLKPLIKKGIIDRDGRFAKAKEYEEKCWNQMRDLNMLFDSDVEKRLTEQTLTGLKFDPLFDTKRLAHLEEKYGFSDDLGENCSVLSVVSGEYEDNPFVVERVLTHRIGIGVYHGSITIHWTTYHRDSNGKRVANHHTDVLTATVEKPKPYYSQATTLVYGNEAAPDLKFSRKPAYVDELSSKEIDKKVEKQTKKIRKKQEKALKNGGSNFTELGNAEFDALFNALDRNNEVQFRLLYTPLAQKNVTALLRDNEVGYGDDFYQTKSGCLNYVTSTHASVWALDGDYRKFSSFDYDESQKRFLEETGEFFRSLYFDFAPLWAIPLYQQYKPSEYFMKKAIGRNFTVHETESLLNGFAPDTFFPKEAQTECIIKTALDGTDEKLDYVTVTAHGYRTEKRTDYVSKFGGDGKFHTVPVPWVEYIPVERTSKVTLGNIGLTDKEYEKAQDDKVFSTCGNKSFKHGLFGFTAETGVKAFDEVINKFKTGDK